MKRTSIAALMAAPLLLAFPGYSDANPREQCTYGYGCGGMCLNLFSRIHQHGPLFNYGPYYGYPPFEPYGPWNAYLQYNPWYYGYGTGGGHAWGSHLASLFHKHHDGCGHCGLSLGWHSHWSHGGWFRGHGCLTCGHGGHSGGRFSGFFQGHGCKSCGTGAAGGCGSGGCVGGGCKSAAFNPETTDPVTRYSGVGSPAETAGFYAGLPSLSPEVVPTAGVAK